MNEGPAELVLAAQGVVVTDFSPSDLAELLVLQRCCWVPEAILNESLTIPALTESAEDVRAWTATHTTLVARLDGRLIGAVRGRIHRTPDEDLWEIGRLMVAPDLAGRGLGRALLQLIERRAPDAVRTLYLFTGSRSERNLRMYQRAGYRIVAAPAQHPAGMIRGLVHLSKSRH